VKENYDLIGLTISIAGVVIAVLSLIAETKEVTTKNKIQTEI
jgi:hypothetical protein